MMGSFMMLVCSLAFYAVIAFLNSTISRDAGSIVDELLFGASLVSKVFMLLAIVCVLVFMPIGFYLLRRGIRESKKSFKTAKQAVDRLTHLGDQEDHDIIDVASQHSSFPTISDDTAASAKDI